MKLSIVLHLLHLIKDKTWEVILGDPVAGFLRGFERERVLLSKIPGNRTVGFRRNKKGKRSTQSRLRVDPGFVSFDKLQKVGVSAYLVLFPFLSVFRCFGWFEAMRGRFIGLKTWDRSVRIFGSRFGQSRHCYGLLWVLL